jgi:hypothetical protein
MIGVSRQCFPRFIRLARITNPKARSRLHHFLGDNSNEASSRTPLITCKSIRSFLSQIRHIMLKFRVTCPKQAIVDEERTWAIVGIPKITKRTSAGHFGH